MTVPPKSSTILFACGYVVPGEDCLYKFSEAARKKIAGYVSLLANVGIEVRILPLAAVSEQFFRRRVPFPLQPIVNPIFNPLRLMHAIYRLFAHLSSLFLERHSCQTLVIYNYSWETVTLAFISRYILKMRVILDYEDGIFIDEKHKRYHSMMESAALRISDAAILSNGELRARLPENMPNLVVSGIFPDFTLPKGKQPKPVLLYSGNIDMDFGLGILMEVLSTLEMASLEIHVTGGGKGAERLRIYLEEHHLPHVHYHGFIPFKDLLDLEERASGYLVLQNEDSPYYSTNYPSKFFYYLGRLKPVFVNRCSLFEPFLSIPNAIAIDRPADAAIVIQQYIDREVDHQTVRIMMQEYNQEIGRALGELLLGNARET